MTRPRPALRAVPVSAVFEWVLIVAGFLVLFFLLPHMVVGDDVVRFGSIEALLHDGDLTSQKYSLVMPLFSAPFLLLGEIVRSPEWWAGRFNVIFVAAGALAAFGLLRGRVDAVLLRRFVLLLLFASFMTDRLREYDSEVLTATLTALGIVALLTGRRLAGWTALVVGAVNTPAATLALALVAGIETVRTRRLRNLVPIAAAVLLIMAEDWTRRGGPLRTGYTDDHGYATVLPYSGRPGFSYPFLLGVLSILFAFGRGLVFYTPGIALWLSGRTRRLAKEHGYAVWLMLLFVVGLVLAYAKWWAWYGGTSWGPRFFLFAAIPSSFLIALRLRRVGESAVADAVTLFFLVFSAWVGLAGAIDNHSLFSFCFANQYALESMCWYTPEFSSLWHPLVQFPPLTRSLAIVAGYCALVFAYLAAPAAAALGRAVRAARVPPAWREDWRL
jgi:hypothetical protein